MRLDERGAGYRELLELGKLGGEALRARRAFFGITDEDLGRLISLRWFAEKYIDEINDGLYELILGHEPTRAFFPDQGTVQRVKAKQREYFLGLFSGVCDGAYAEDRLRIGVVHERIGMPPVWYLGTYACYLHLIHDRLSRELQELDKVRAAYASIKKLVFFDMSLAIDTYIAANLQTITRHQVAVRELSSPVIEVYDGVLLLPLVGSMDSQRALQITETILTKVVEKSAKVLIMDLAGIAAMDTMVAKYLVETTASLRLLGCQTVLTGLRSHLARTLVRLHVDTSTLTTTFRLADGIQLALQTVGMEIKPIQRRA